MANPLLDMSDLPPFDAIDPRHIEPAVDRVLADNRDWIRQRLEQGAPFTWDNFGEPMDEMADRLDRVWAPVSHLHSVANTPELRQAHESCLSKLSDYATELGQDEALQRAYQAIRDGDAFAQLSTEKQKVVENTLRDFRLSGVDLPPDDKARYKALKSELSSLTTTFANHLLDATNAWSLTVTDEARLAGIPETSRAMLRQAAEREGDAGWRITLDFPSFIAVMTHAEDRSLRETVYHAFVTRASDVVPHAGEWDNGPIMDRILAIRHELAGLLGFANYAERSLATKMAENPEQVLRFLEDLAEQALPRARREIGELERYAAESGGPSQLAPWDVAFWGEKLREARYAVSQEQLKPWFPADRVVDGLFRVVERLFGIRVTERTDVAVWHPDVRFFEIRDGNN